MWHLLSIKLYYSLFSSRKTWVKSRIKLYIEARLWEGGTAAVVCLCYNVEATSVSKCLAFLEQLISLGYSKRYHKNTALIWLLGTRTGQTHVGALGNLTIWRPFQSLFLNFFGLRQAWPTFQRLRAQIGDTCWRNFSRVET